MSIRVVVADDQDLVRTGLVMILDAQPDLEVVGQAADGLEALDVATRLRPDVLLVDIRMPGLDGVEVTRRLAGPNVTDPMAVVVITTFDLDEYVLGALRAGARGFLLKDAGPELLVQAIHAAADGDALIAPNVTRRLLATFADQTPAVPDQPIDPLTEREEEDDMVPAYVWSQRESMCALANVGKSCPGLGSPPTTAGRALEGRWRGAGRGVF